jgi:hypothetical protein
MPAEIVWLGLWNRRRSMIDYAVGMALGMLVIVVLYPSFKHSTRAQQLTQGQLAAGGAARHTSHCGWMLVTASANFVPLIMLLLPVGYGSGAIAVQVEDGALGFRCVARRPAMAGASVRSFPLATSRCRADAARRAGCEDRSYESGRLAYAAGASSRANLTRA